MKIKSVIGALFLIASMTAQADPLDQFEACVMADGVASNVGNGTINCRLTGATAGNVDDSGLGADNLGSVTVEVTGVGEHNVSMYGDWEIEQETNTFFNEHVATGGALEAGQSWQADRYNNQGSIFDRFVSNTLNGVNGVSAAFADAMAEQDVICCDVTMALGWVFTLLADQVATIVFTISDVMPDSGFWLAQVDRRSGTTYYFSSVLSIRDGNTVPEPGTLLLLGAGLLALGVRRRFGPQK